MNVHLKKKLEEDLKYSKFFQLPSFRKLFRIQKKKNQNVIIKIFIYLLVLSFIPLFSRLNSMLVFFFKLFCKEKTISPRFSYL